MNGDVKSIYIQQMRERMNVGNGPIVVDGVETFIIKIDDIHHLTIAPDQDIFSDQAYINMGQPALDYVIDYLENEKGLRKKKHRLVLSMPPDKIILTSKDECEAAIDRYATVMIEDNRFRMAAVRRKGLLQIPYAMVFLTICVALGLAFGNEAFPGVPVWLSTVVGEGFFIIGWVALWGPTESLRFERFPFVWRNRALRALGHMPVEVRPR
jgi:hypothetical protein